MHVRPCGPMDKASVYGTGDCRFESYQGHFILRGTMLMVCAVCNSTKKLEPLWRNG